MSTSFLIKYANKWVALTPDRKKVVAFAEDIQALDTKVKKLKNSEVIYHHVLPVDGNYAP